ncbi:MAG: Crp/Fnr family transcriptional regulator, partial [Erythrobacter sp.]|nr:Crp/Fnr family transcriptional regulator [Erythrobacter sp.]
LPSLSVAEPIDTLIALNKVVICDIPAANFAEMFTGMPRLATILFLVSQEERMLAMERIALMGRASAASRLAAFVLRLHERLGQGSDEAPMTFPFPLTQVEIGDLIGISAVHVNAVLKHLRESRIAAIRDRELQILDFDALVQTAGVQPWQRADPSWLKSSMSQ